MNLNFWREWKKADAFNFTLFHFISSLHKENNNNNNIRERDTHTLGLDLFVFVDETIALLLQSALHFYYHKSHKKQILLFFGWIFQLFVCLLLRDCLFYEIMFSGWVGPITINITWLMSFTFTWNILQVHSQRITTKYSTLYLMHHHNNAFSKCRCSLDVWCTIVA